MRTQNDGIPLEAVANYGPARPIAIARWLYVMAALVVAMVLVGGITSDRLYPLRQQQELADLLPGCPGLSVVDSIYGHDGFLVETDAVAPLIRQTLDIASR